MKRKIASMKMMFLPVLLSVSTVAPIIAHAQDEPAPSTRPAPAVRKSVEDAFTVLITAIRDDNYVAFLSVADQNVKAGLKKEVFETLVAMISPRLKKGFEVTYLGELDQQGFKMHLWKLHFNDRDDDVLAQMSWRGGKVGGFLLR
jgi:hypothetical protein